MQLTSQQQAILLADGHSVAVSAGAGCGKTFVLTQRFLKFLAAGGHSSRVDPLSRIVAITFTDKAAREMRQRVRTATAAALRDCDAAAVPHWLGILRGLETARISTIHGYCSQLLRASAVEAELDPSFGLLESAFGNTYLGRAARTSLCRDLESEEPDATELVALFGFERALSLVESLMGGIAGADVPLDQLDAAALVELWRKAWFEQLLPEQLRQFRESSAYRTTAPLLREVQPDSKKMQDRRTVLRDVFAALGDPDTSATDAVGCLPALREHATFAHCGRAKWGDEPTHETLKETFAVLRKEADTLTEQHAAFLGDATAAAELTLRVHRVTAAAAAEYAALKRSLAMLDYDDLLISARNLLRDRPAVRRRAARGIDLLMVDEFQDTDPVQADLVRLLCGEALDEPLTSDKLFLVGDAKQSIYRFRKADPAVFAGLREELPAAGRLPLSTNFRSTPQVLAFVNHLFAADLPNYELLVPSLPQNCPEPAIEFLFCTAEDAREKVDLRRAREARWTARRIVELLADPTPRVQEKDGRLRRVQAGDICLLVRTWNSTIPFEKALTTYGLEYYVSGGKAFFTQQEIHDLAHLCRWLDDSTDELSLAGVLRSPLFGLNDDTLMLLGGGSAALDPGWLWAGLGNPSGIMGEQAAQVGFARSVLTELQAKKDILPLAELMRLVLERTGYDAALLCEHLGSRKLANLRKLIGLAETFDSAGSLTLSEFVASLSQAVQDAAGEQLAATHPEVSDVIRIMTVHQAKGLEFPVVVLVDTNAASRGPQGNTYHPQFGPIFKLPETDEQTTAATDDDGDDTKQTDQVLGSGEVSRSVDVHPGRVLYNIVEQQAADAEALRLLYVAATRAKDLLILAGCLNPNGQPKSTWLKLVARRFDLATGLPPGDALLGAMGGTAVLPTELPAVRVHHEEPAAGTGHAERRDQGPLREFRERLDAAEAAVLPALAVPCPVTAEERREFSVTDLCNADALRQPPTTRTRPAAAVLPAESEPGEDRRLLGTLAHAVLERIDFGDAAAIAPAAVAALIERYIFAERGEVNDNLQGRVLRAVTALLDSPLRPRLASAARLHREIEFRLRWGNDGTEISGVIDCLFQMADGDWHLVDYKAVEAVADDPAATIQQYGLQLMTYALAVQRQFGRVPASATLVRLGPPATLHTIPLDAATLAEATSRIDAAMAALRAS